MTDTWTWATVTQASPLRIKVDGDTSALDATTDNLVGSLAVDDRVRVHLHADGIIVTGLQGGGNRSNPNLLINSDFMVNQRGVVSGASVVLGDYFLDRWKNSGVSTTGFTWADSGGIRTLTIGAIGNPRQCAQVVEQSSVIAGAHTLSWSGTAQARVYNSGASAPSFAASPLTVTLDGTANVLIEFNGASETVIRPKFERGSAATPYQPPTYDDNLRACMFYYQRFVYFNVATQYAIGYAITSTLVEFGIPLLAPMRAATPTLTYAALNIYDGAATTVSSLVFRGPGTNAINVRATVGSATTYRPYGLLVDGSTSFIALDAEL